MIRWICYRWAHQPIDRSRPGWRRDVDGWRVPQIERLGEVDAPDRPTAEAIAQRRYGTVGLVVRSAIAFALAERDSRQVAATRTPVSPAHLTR